MVGSVLHLDRVEASLTKADNKISKAIDADVYDKLQKAVSESADDVSDASDS